MENKLQDDFKWELNQVSDMCDPEAPMTQVMDYNNIYYDENTGEILDPNLVKESEQEEMNRFKKMKVYTYVTRREAEQDPRGVLVKVKWVRINKAPGFARRFDAGWWPRRSGEDARTTSSLPELLRLPR